jgi:hypothetical protein
MEVEPFLLRFVCKIRDDNVNSKDSEFNLFSALFVLVDGELARTRLLANSPPFYRRLASLAQAALIQRQLMQCGIDYGHFSKMAFSNRGEHFYMQSLADMRTEPRWTPGFVEASQLQADLFGRIIIAGNAFKANFEEGELRNIILGDGELSLIKQCEFPRPYLPGVLEGTEDNPNALPEEIECIIEEQLNNHEVEISSFIPLVNSAMIYRIPFVLAEMAAKKIKFSHYKLGNIQNKSRLLAILNGLATVAAVSRSPVLADELCIIVRRYRRDTQYRLSIQEALNILLLASAAWKDLSEWRKFVGDFLTDFAFSELDKEEGEQLYSHLTVLLHSVPELWISCGKAEAALQAWRCR